jgi:hypothetical protein
MNNVRINLGCMLYIFTSTMIYACVCLVLFKYGALKIDRSSQETGIGKSTESLGIMSFQFNFLWFCNLILV